MAMCQHIPKLPTIINSDKLYLKGRGGTSKHNIHQTITCKFSHSMYRTESYCTDLIINDKHNNSKCLALISALRIYTHFTQKQ